MNQATLIHITTRIVPFGDEAELEAEKSLLDLPRERGFCRALWAAQKRILKEEYNIDWKSPSEMNPEILID